MGHTPLIPVRVTGMPELELFLKDESQSPTGNLKHRFAWALFMWAIVEGYVGPNTTVYEASSGNTATCEAYMAQLVGVPFIAVVPNTTEQTKIDRIKQYGGDVLKVDITEQFIRAEAEAKRNGGFYMNQFANADKAEEFHESGGHYLETMNVFHEVALQLQDHDNSTKHEYPTYFVHSAGTGGTISSVGRYVKKYNIPTQVVMADTEFSIYYDFVINGKFQNESGASLWRKPGMAGTGFGYAGPAIHGITTSLQPAVIDRALKIPDLASTASMHFMKEIDAAGGTSTGLNFVTALSLAAKHRQSHPNQKFRIVLLRADAAKLYEATYYNNSWIAKSFAPHGGLNVFACWRDIIKRAFETGFDPLAEGEQVCAPAHVAGHRFRFRRA